ncbi:4Fe-4S dicluster domain-containing protein [Egibacter rhizosphaerae]|uniref:4Fe-4S dicluster domain-containing protein n=1 Tax=Egibacter rhizosphaerae TaxID=1670831 RepID=A0A411YGC1_9ACTN|nr:LUD domain-containing protein [Egibacter rhizosphaerae]QBI20207.1 4Fe-4S dicluster domain-containing protein [Egibacter rhizosphaerae]
MKPFEQRYAEALADENVARGLQAFQQGWRAGRDAQVAALEEAEGRSFDELRGELAAVKDHVLEHWDDYLDEFEARATAAGATVTRVGTPEEANRFIIELCRARGVDLAVKGKSMVSEEIGLNDAFEAAGITPVETDLGEWLLQLAGEHPSHLVMPAIHKRKEQIAALLERVLGREFPPDDVPRMVQVARTELRDRFLAGGVGLSGANALVASGGTVMLVCNEGNNRMSVALPKLHVVTAGAEKLVPTFADAVAQVRLLARSATGQPITVYTNFVTGPRPGQEQHIVLVDNGRAAMAADPDVASALRCIRCGACANVCPPYAVVGGHAFGHVYTGAIGLVNTLWHHGVDAAAGPQSLCVSCGACATVCPVDIPLPTQILETRHRVMRDRPETRDARLRRLVFRAFASRRLVGSATRAAGLLAGPVTRDGLARVPRPLAGVPALARRTSWRTPPAPARTPARDRLRPGRQPEVGRLGETAVTGRTVLLFLQCVTDRLAPAIAVSAARLLRAAGARVVVRRQQHCCGLPAFDAGDWDRATAMVRDTLDALDGVDDVVTPAPSCVAMLGHEAPRLLRDEPGEAARLRRLAARTHDLVDYLTGPARLPAGALDTGDRSPVTVHRFCQSTNTLGRRDEMERLVRDVAGAPVVALPEATECCGFGGSTSLANPEVASRILGRKLTNVDRTGAHTLVSDNPGCLLHLKGGVDASGRTIDVRHIAEYLAARLPGAA